MRTAVFVMLLSVCLILVVPSASAYNFLVYTTADSGPGSLRQAIFDANGYAGADTVSFVFPGTAVQTITITSALPVIYDPLTIDGMTMPGASQTGRPLIELTTAYPNSLSGLDLRTAGCVIRGLIINRFYFGISLGQGGGHTIQGNWIGLASNGVSAALNDTGIGTGSGSSYNRIGGTTAAQRNVISGNGVGVNVAGFWLPEYVGVNGINNVIEGNFIGTDHTGTVAVPNRSGIVLNGDAENTLIGGLFPDGAVSRNIISGNTHPGITVWSEVGRTNIQYNWIGLNVNGDPLGNSTSVAPDGRTQSGIYASGTTTVAYNRIAHNYGSGVRVLRQYVDFYANSIFSNERLGISFDHSFPRLNDPGDADKGIFGRQNHPIITSALSESAQLKISGTLNSTANSNFLLQFFSNPSCDPSGYGEGQTWVGGTSVNTDASGNGTFNVTLAVVVPAGAFITATARDAALNGSEFSPCRQTTLPPPASVTDINPSSAPYGSSVTITGSGFSWATSVVFDVGKTASFTINSDTQITTTVPHGALSGYIRVNSPYGQGAGLFTVNNPAPTISSVFPNTGPASGGSEVRIDGSGFLPGALVYFGLTQGTSVTVLNPNVIGVITPSHFAGVNNVSVLNVDEKGVNAIDAFTFYCTPELSATITAPSRVRAYSSGNVASVPDGGPGVTYEWFYDDLTTNIISGNGTRSVVFLAGDGSSGDVYLIARVIRADCTAEDDRRIPITPPTGDFNADSMSDLLWRNYSTGEVNVWFMSGTTYQSGASLFSVTDANWRLETSGDFDGNRSPDLLWRNYATGAVNVWFMSGTTYLSGANLFTVSDPNWEIEGAADFNGDNKVDIIWRNYATGAVNVWYLDGTTYIGGASLFTLADSNWRLEGTGDFDGDGDPDLIWRNYSTGSVNIWFLTNGVFTAGATMITVTDLNWKIQAIEDYTGDGKPDLVWRNYATGAVNVWRMNGATYVSGTNLTTVPGTSWEISGPR